MKNLVLQIYKDGDWHNCANIKIAESQQSFYSKTTLSYETEYFFEFAQFEGTRGHMALSTLLPLDLCIKQASTWPSFLLDLIPQGFARKAICDRERIVNNQENDAEILAVGALNPIGNLRVKNDNDLFTGTNHPGFTTEDLIAKNEEFLDHAEEYGALIVGTTGAQGMAPKFLLNQDQSGNWHCDGALKDEEVLKSFIVKFPRGKSKDDKLILEAEKPYLDIARELGVHTFAPLYYEGDVLFIPRFDRKKLGNVMVRHGVESLASVLGLSDFASKITVEDCLQALSLYSTNPKEDILEYIFRDFLNVAMGNTDNHGRNTALLKTPDGEIRLSPLFDFAPMVLDPQMIPRNIKWTHEKNYIPDFHKVSDFLQDLDFETSEIQNFLRSSLSKLATLEELFIKHKVDQDVLQRATRKLSPLIKSLQSYLGVSNEE